MMLREYGGSRLIRLAQIIDDNDRDNVLYFAIACAHVCMMAESCLGYIFRCGVLSHIP